MSKGGRSRAARRTSATPAPTTQAAPRKSSVAAPVTAPKARSAPARPAAPAPKPTSARPATPALKAAPAAAASVPSAAPVSPLMRGLSAITRAFPYALVEYVIFLGIVEDAQALTVAVGITLIVVAALIFGALRYAPLPGNRQTWERMLASWTGDVTVILASIALMGLGLLAWAQWHVTMTGAFSVFSWILLLIAMALVVVAHYRQETAEAA